MAVNREGVVGVAGDRHQAEAVALVREDSDNSEGNGGTACIATHSVNQCCVRRGDESC